MKKRLSLVSIITILLVFITTYAYAGENPQFSLDLGGWLAKIDANIKSGKGVSSIDVMGEIGIDERKTIFPVSIDLNIGGSYSLFADFYSYSISGNKKLDDAISFNQETFAASVLTRGTYKHNSFRTGVKYNISSQKDSNIHVIGGVLYEKLQLDLSNAIVSTTDSLNIPFPFIGCGMEQLIGQQFSWGGSVEGLVLSFQEYNTTYFDFTLFMKYFLTQNLSLKAGYRYENIDGEKDDQNFSSSQGGVYIGANLGW